MNDINNIEELFNKINEVNTYLVIDSKIKKQILRQKTEYEIKNKTLLKFKFLTEEELLNKLTFETDINIIQYNNTPVTITKDIIKYSKYNLNNEIKNLTNFIKENNKYIIRNTNFINKINNYKFYFLEEPIYLKKQINYYKLNYEIIKLKSKEITPKAIKFKNQEEEIIYLFEKISNKILDDNKIINNIYISNVNESYTQIINKYQRLYNIPINTNNKIKLYDLYYIKDLINNNEITKLIEILNDKDELLNRYQDIRIKNQNLFDESINSLISIINQYKITSKLKEVIIYEAKNKNINNIKYTNSINIINIEEIPYLPDNSIVYILNASYTNFPTIKKDNDYLSDKEKEIISYPTSTMENTYLNNKYQKIIKNSKIEYISYSKRDNYNEYTPSDIILPFLEKVDTKIKLTKGFQKDTYRKLFSRKDEILDKTLITFNNNFKFSDKTKLKNYLNNINIKLSPTTFETYLKIPFMYYIKYILKVDHFKETISLILGNFFHKLVEILYNKINTKEINIYNFNSNEFYNREFNNYFEPQLKIIKKINETNKIEQEDLRIIKTIFQIKRNENKIKEALNFLIEYEQVDNEAKIYPEYQVEEDKFKGRLDLLKIYENENKYSIVDFKTGKKTSYNKENILSDLELLNKDYNSDIEMKDLDLLQLLLYESHIKNKELKYVAYFSFLENNLKFNQLNTEELNKKFFTKSDKRLLTKEEKEKINKELEKVFNTTYEKINNLEFDLIVRTNSNKQTNLYQEYGDFEAICFFTKYNTNDNEEENGEELERLFE